MVFKKLCVRVHWMKVASALEGLNLINVFEGVDIHKQTRFELPL